MQFATVVEFPGDAAGGKVSGSGDRRTGAVLAHARGVDHEAARWHAAHQCVVAHWILVADGLKVDVCPHFVHHRAQLGEASRRAVDDHESVGAVAGVRLVNQVQGDGGCRAACAKAQHLAARARKVAFSQDRIQATARDNRVEGVPLERATTLGDARDFAAGPCIGVEQVKHVARSIIEIDLVRGDQRAQGERIELDLCDSLAVAFRRVVQRQVNALDHDVRAVQVPQPQRKDLHDRRPACRDPDKGERRHFLGDDRVPVCWCVCFQGALQVSVSARYRPPPRQRGLSTMLGCPLCSTTRLRNPWLSMAP